MAPQLYTAYGLSIASEMALPELAPLEACQGCEGAAVPSPQVVVRAGRALEPGSFGEDCGNLRAEVGSALLAWAEVGRFRLRGGREVLAEPVAGIPEEVLRAFVLGPVLATLLFQRGFLLLHASAAALPEAGGGWGAVAFVGDSGVGKSTMAAALHARGLPVVADDYIAVPPLEPGPREASPLIFPGYAQLRLLPRSLEALGSALGQDLGSSEREVLPPLYEGHHKRVRRVDRGFGTRALPLRRVYVLEEGREVRALPIEPARSVAELARHLFCASLLSPQVHAAQFQRCGALAAAVEVRRLQRPRDLHLLGDVARVVQDEHQAR